MPLGFNFSEEACEVSSFERDWVLSCQARSLKQGLWIWGWGQQQTAPSDILLQKPGQHWVNVEEQPEVPSAALLVWNHHLRSWRGDWHPSILSILQQELSLHSMHGNWVEERISTSHPLPPRAQLRQVDGSRLTNLVSCSYQEESLWDLWGEGALCFQRQQPGVVSTVLCQQGTGRKWSCFKYHRLLFLLDFDRFSCIYFLDCLLTLRTISRGFKWSLFFFSFSFFLNHFHPFHWGVAQWSPSLCHDRKGPLCCSGYCCQDGWVLDRLSSEYSYNQRGLPKILRENMSTCLS